MKEGSKRFAPLMPETSQSREAKNKSKAHNTDNKDDKKRRKRNRVQNSHEIVKWSTVHIVLMLGQVDAVVARRSTAEKDSMNYVKAVVLGGENYSASKIAASIIAGLQVCTARVEAEILA